ncbi:MAG: bifunctional adenosylcobinamide kinase/adenosylcobinamide-phosphate guanylyltransferase [Candidatus Kuenenia sp.]|nr:bifunctional adenosylcobinamide kinase/adenosylcobinamide-phosphate guanylyltransferase [Candidatus Kuenenia hertensis]
MAKITLVLGGARSGKSSFAENMAKHYRTVVYAATAEIKDDEMRERIRIHRERRPSHWQTVESPYDLEKVVFEQDKKAALVFIDCITLYITNLLLRLENQDSSQIIDKIHKLCRICEEITPDVIIVSNEVGLGIVPENALARHFLDIAGSVNQILAQHATEVYFVVSGIAQKIK